MPSSTLSQLDALTGYLGGKRKLAPAIFAAMDRAGYGSGEGHVLLDPFMGSGAVSLVGKLMGYQVHANDVSVRSEAFGVALIENSSETLSDADLVRALEMPIDGWYMPSDKVLPWRKDVKELLVRLCVAAEQYDDHRRAALMRSLMVKVALRMALWGQVRATANASIRDEAWDKMSSGQVGAMGPFFHPHREMRTSMHTLNRGVCDNGLANSMSCMDVLAFLADQPADVVYLDPPYPGTVAYETEYLPLDELLSNHEILPENSRFSAKDGWKFLGDVYDAAEHIPVWVLSLGNETVEMDQLVEVMRERGRVVEAQEIEYSHLASQATAEKTAGNKEFILTATKE